MMFKKFVQHLLVHPLARNSKLDSPETSRIHYQLIRAKPFLRQFYRECYSIIAGSLPQGVKGPVLEIGAGAGFMKDTLPEVITSELLVVPNVDILLDAGTLPIKDKSLRAIVMFDVFHHIKSVAGFLHEAARVIMPGGAIIMIEPWVTNWSSLIYRHLHHEPFDPDAREWKLPEGGPLSVANSALPTIVFERDRARFSEEFREWQIECITPHSPFCYLLSGGLSFRSFMPGYLYEPFRRIEKGMQRFYDRIAMFATIVLRRKPLPALHREDQISAQKIF